MKNYLSFLLIATIFVSCSDHKTAVKTKTAVATIKAKSNSNVSGEVIFTETNGKVSMVANIKGLSAGNHAIHIHQIGDCSADNGSSAGGHWNPTNVGHGVWGTAPFHIGDIGNIVGDANGNGTISRETDLWCVGCKDETKNVVGKAIIIHEGPDDFTSQPSGAAGPRIGCGEITLK
ncbi:superoxide dismutase family protein [Tenacibaculum maritimum]|uniref:superoxide dismutase family protein n=1 Tax=Tenacibaculum maritimum TaxID=107401 RepID=UPI0012E6E534|nr:superoxide dismutase family protein [Tenacibaculum maritimum]CAA0227734.1 Superoxide dismutase (Cu-Zn) 2 [Tenacibaculum maritimum]